MADSSVHAEASLSQSIVCRFQQSIQIIRILIVSQRYGRDQTKSTPDTHVAKVLKLALPRFRPTAQLVP